MRVPALEGGSSSSSSCRTSSRDVTYVGNFGGDQENNGDESTSSGGGIKFVVQLQNVFEGKPDEITCPWKPPRKRTIVMKDADDNTDDVAKKFKIVYDQNVDEGDPEPHIQGHQLVRLRDVSQDIQDHITTIQSRIPVINDLWKHRCGDN
uniref:Uncharacterized protein n=1 Tax=Heliothis virescens TaxID=7102 RepID=A0A2A4ISB3_HELVI